MCLCVHSYRTRDCVTQKKEFVCRIVSVFSGKGPRLNLPDGYRHFPRLFQLPSPVLSNRLFSRVNGGVDKLSLRGTSRTTMDVSLRYGKHSNDVQTPGLFGFKFRTDTVNDRHVENTASLLRMTRLSRDPNLFRGRVLTVPVVTYRPH